MIDLHYGILPGVDGGAGNIEESLMIARRALEGGIDTIIAAPPHVAGEYHNPPLKIKKQVDVLNRRLKEENLALRIIPGQRVRMHTDMAGSQNQNALLPLHLEKKYLLTELPPDQQPANLTNIRFDLQMKQYIPILAHPELHPAIQEEPNEVYLFVKSGALVMIDAGSILGLRGKKVKQTAHQLIEANLAHFVISGNHDDKRKKFYLKKAYRQIDKTHGHGISDTFQQNLRSVETGRYASSQEPQPVKAKKLFGFLGRQ